METPHNWLLLEMIAPNGEKLYKVLAGWSGGFVDRDRWRLNSGVVKMEDEGDAYLFHGYSGSTYRCYKTGRTSSMAIAPTLSMLLKKFPDKVRVVDENVDLTQIKWV